MLRCTVIINGLVANPELNGKTGTTLSCEDDTGRYSVKLDEPPCSTVLVKRCNLLLFTPVCSGGSL
jgi:hypothetical protein